MTNCMKKKAKNEYFASLNASVKSISLCLILLCCFVATAFAQQAGSGFTVSGIIKDDKGEPLIGASVVVKSTTTGVVTDLDGKYQLNVPDAKGTLVFSFVGFTSQEIPINNQKEINITLSEGKSLNEVVVVGYGTKKRSDITGSVTSVEKTRLSQLPVTNALQAIQGAVAGVNITQSNSAPGSGTSALVRGVNSISASTNPLIVVDGIPFVGGSINDINSADIASIDILKDASSVAIYGTRGANGVILITTKRGKTGKAQISYSAYGGAESFAHLVKPMNGAEYVQKYADWKAQAGVTNTLAVPNQYEIANHAAGTETDWLKEISQGGNIQNHTLSVAGGSEDVKYYISTDYLNQKGIIKGYQYKRASVRTNIDANLTDFLTAGVNLFLTLNNYDGGRANLTQATTVSPYGTYKRANGSYEVYPMFGELLYLNPLLGTTTTRNERTKNFNSNIFLDFRPTFIKGLKYRLNGSYTYVPTFFQGYIGRAANDLLGTASVNNSETKTWLLENILTWDRTWDKHHVDVTGLYSVQNTDFTTDATLATGFINDNLEFNNLAAASSTSATSSAYATKLLSQMLRFNYAYNSTYLFTATARRDGYSAFGSATSKYGLFPSVAVGWNISNEPFMKGAKFIDNLKLRGSYGLSGNQAIDANATASTFAPVRLPYNGVSTVGVIANVLGNNNLTWESTYGANVGADFSLFGGRIGGTIEAYNTRTKDLLLYRSLPTITGYTRVLDNLGKVANKGIEVTLRTQNIKKGDFLWESNINMSANQNKIVDLFGDQKDDIGNKWFIGQPVNVIYDYKLLGVWQTGEDPSSSDPTAKPGHLKFADLNGSKSITPDDRTILGQRNPKWMGGITNTLHYKNFHLSVFIQTVQGITRDNRLLEFRDFGGRQNLPAAAGYWTPTNKSETRPSLFYNNSRAYGYASDASYTRIKDATLSYTFPETALSKSFLSGATVYVSGRNLGTWTKWIGWDPEGDYEPLVVQTTAANLNTTGSYPLVRSFIFGLNVKLK